MANEEYDMHQSTDMWGSFLRLSKWVVGLSVLILVLMAMFLTGHS